MVDCGSAWILTILKEVLCMRKQQATLTKYREDICSAINNESASVSELANQFRVDKSLLITRIRSWKNQGLISRNVTIHMNGNISKPTATQVVVTPQPAKEPHWWETDLGLDTLDQSEFVYTDEKSMAAVANARYHIYTDGSCITDPSNRESEGPGAWAFVRIECDNSKEIECYGSYAHTTANKMELQAILEAVKTVPDGEPAVVFTDSQFAVMTIKMIPDYRKNGWKTAQGRHPLGLNIISKLYEELQKKTVQIQWLKGHNGSEYNCRCDLLAKTAASKQIHHPFAVPDSEELIGYISLHDAGKILNCSASSVRNYITKGLLESKRSKKWNAIMVSENEVRAMRKAFDASQVSKYTQMSRDLILAQMNGAVISESNPVDYSKWTTADETADLLNCKEEDLAILVSRELIECSLRDGYRIYNIDDADMEEIDKVIAELNRDSEDIAADDIVEELDSELAQNESELPKELDDMINGEDLKQLIGADEEILDRLVETNKIAVVGYNGVKYYNTRGLDKRGLLYCIEEINSVLTSQGSSELAQEPELVAVEVNDKEDDDMKCECSAEEKRFAEFYLRYGAAMTAKKLGCTEEDVAMKWADFMIDYNVELSITKRN
jgi:ribonuclease HI